ncbi:MAG: FMN-binding protein [Acholeplasmataceae bacterium]|nr:FMN-binding protein [Acholeplasmataceae bacterium]
MKKEYIKSSLIIVVVVLVFGGLMFALNFLTGPIIEENNQGAELAPLKEVMPDGVKFELIYDKDNASASTLTGVKDHVSKVYKETTDKGYVFRCETTSQYSKNPMIFTVGITIDGKICGVKVNEYHESLDFKDYPQNYVGKDSTLADVGVFSGVTFSSNAFKEAMEEGFDALIKNNLIKEAVKTDDQILSELILTKHTGLASNGVLKCSTIEASGNIVKGYKGDNGSGFALIMKDNDQMYLVVTNPFGGACVYDVEGKDVTSSHETLVADAKAYQLQNGTDSKDSLITKVGNIINSTITDAQVQELNIFSSVVANVKFTLDGVTYYAFNAKNFSFDSNVMNIFFILDENGAIVKMTADAFVFETDYFTTLDPNWNASNYISGFTGLTNETFDGTQAVIGGATMSTNAMKQATNDVFAAFKLAKAGGNK